MELDELKDLIEFRKKNPPIITGPPTDDPKFVNKIEQQREKEGFLCKQCGACCKETDHVDVYPDDIQRWRAFGRIDLYSNEMMDEWDCFGGSGLFRNEYSSRCPFLRKNNGKNTYYCRIHNIKPLFCRQFPQDKEHAKEFCNCPGYNH